MKIMTGKMFLFVAIISVFFIDGCDSGLSENDKKKLTEYCTNGDANLYTGHYDKAIEEYNKAIEIDPNDASIYVNRGRAKQENGDYREAIKDYSKAIEVDPKYSTSYSHRGGIKFDLGDKRGAIEDFSKAINLDPKNENIGRWYYNRGVAKFQIGLEDGCIDLSKAGEQGMMEAYELINEYCK